MVLLGIKDRSKIREGMVTRSKGAETKVSLGKGD